MTWLRQAWDRFWFSPYDPLPAGVFRISLGLLLFAYYFALGPNWERYYAPDGVAFLDPADPDLPPQTYTVFHLTAGVIPLRAFWLAGLVAAGCLTLGYYTRAATVFLFLLGATLVQSNPMVSNGEDPVTRMLLLYGIFAPLDRALSVDGWLRRRRGEEASLPPPAGWPIRLMQVNIALIYALSLPDKLADAQWQEGTALYWSMMNATWSRWPWPEFFYSHWVSALATYGAAAIEAAFPLLVWFRPTRLPVLAAITALHLGIAVTLNNVAFFSFSMICSFWLWVPAETLRAWGAALRGMARKLIPQAA